MTGNSINVGLLGFGTVGSGTYDVLTRNAEEIARKVGVPLVVRKVAVRDKTRARAVPIDPALITDNPDEIIDDPKIDIVCELIGGVEPARKYVLAALENGKHVVTANKEMIAKAGHDLMLFAEAHDLDFLFEGSVCGGIPIIQPLKQALAGNRIHEIVGIVNGTTNYILTKMARDGSAFSDVLAEAQALGYAEPDPTNDVMGYDAQFKIAILASIAFNSRVDISDVNVEGIIRLSPRDFEMASVLGYVIKLIGIGRETAQGLRVRVHPALLPRSHALANVNDVYNAVYVRGDAVGDVMFYGRGAGADPTGSAVVGDLIEICRNMRSGGAGRLGCTCFHQKTMLPMRSLRARYYVRVVAFDRPKVLASVANVFGDFDVSIETVEQRTHPGGEAEIVLLTHETVEQNFLSALEILGRLPVIVGVENWIRIEE